VPVSAQKSEAHFDQEQQEEQEGVVEGAQPGAYHCFQNTSKFPLVYNFIFNQVDFPVNYFFLGLSSRILNV
jgi:hypothetical protein